MEKKLKRCQVCGKTIEKKRNHSWLRYLKRKYCSRQCTAQALSQKVVLTCDHCGKEFKRSPSHARGENHYCSQKCRHLDKTTPCTCEICGKQFRRPDSNMIDRTTGEPVQHTYCSLECQGIAKRADNYDSQGRRSPEDIAWRNAVLERDGYTCQMCESHKNLEAHHIKPVQDFPELRHDIDNGQCLCHDCHYYGIHNGAPNFIHGRYSTEHQ